MTQRTQTILSWTLFALGVLWGGYTLLAYIGAPIHQLAFMERESIATVDKLCGVFPEFGTFQDRVNSYYCRGFSSLGFLLEAVLEMGSPFIPYTVLSIVLFGGLLFWIGFSTGVFRRVFMVRPVIIIAAFGVMVWLLGTTLALSSLNNVRTPDGAKVDAISSANSGVSRRILPPFRRIYEPTAEAISGLSPDAAAALRKNFDELQARGCLSPLKNALGEELVMSSGVRVYNISLACIQQSFFSRAGLQFVLVLFFLFTLIVLGRAIIEGVLRLHSLPPPLLLVMSVGVGALVLIAALWTAAVTGVLTQVTALLLFILPPIVLYPWSIRWIREALRPSIPIEVSWKSVQVLLGWLLLSYLALNFLNVVRPFPIGWDDLGSYLNRPRLLSSYGSFIPSMSQFQWEYLTSLGFLLFGYDSFIGATFAMQINWAAGLIAVLATYVSGRMLFGPRAGLLAAILYYFLPMTGHFSFADMKIDNASYFTTVLAVLAVLWHGFRIEDRDGANLFDARRVIFLAGLLAGLSFAVKATGILGIFLCLSLLLSSRLQWMGFLGGSLFGLIVLLLFGPIEASAVLKQAGSALSVSDTYVAIPIGLLALGLFVACSILHRNETKRALIDVGLFLLGIIIACIVWGSFNMAANQHFSFGAALKAPDTTAPLVFYEQQEDVERMSIPPTAPVRFLPPELKLDPEHPACKGSAKVEELDRYWGFEKSLNHYLTLPWRQVMNIDSYGYYVTLMPALLLLPLILLLPFFWRKENAWLRFVAAGTFVFLLEWMVVANGVSWYGIGMFLGFSLLLEAFVAKAPDRKNRWLFAVFLTLSIFVCLVNRFWQFDTQRNMFEYPLGKISAKALQEVTISNYDDIRESVVARHEALPETPYTYRIGTFISYFIPRNRDIFPLADHQMLFFNCINQERDHVLTLRRLKALGFNGIIFDTNTHTIEKNESGPLHQKVQAFLNFANDPALALTISVNDPGSGVAYILLP